jgi:hypothetical protein
VGSNFYLNVVAKRKVPAFVSEQTPVVQPIASHHTDRANPAFNEQYYKELNTRGQDRYVKRL